jgi:hypothetical protein
VLNGRSIAQRGGLENREAQIHLLQNRTSVPNSRVVERVSTQALHHLSSSASGREVGADLYSICVSAW